MNLKRRLNLLRKNIRNSSADVVEKLIQKNGDKDLCVFCGAKQDLTKEHVLPQWTFKSKPNKHFVTTINGLTQEYIKTVVPACSECNSNILGSLEKQIKSSFEAVDLETVFFSKNEIDKIISWLEIIDFKFQVLNLRRKFLKHKDAEYIPYLSDIPLSLMQNLASISLDEVREKAINSSNRISTQSKETMRNSLLVFKTKNPDFLFFHDMDDFIFLELPRFDIGVFLFLKKKFNQHEQAYEEALEIMDKVY